MAVASGFSIVAGGALSSTGGLSASTSVGGATSTSVWVSGSGSRLAPARDHQADDDGHEGDADEGDDQDEHGRRGHASIQSGIEEVPQMGLLVARLVTRAVLVQSSSRPGRTPR